MVFLKASYGKFLSLKGAYGIGRRRRAGECCDTGDAMLGGCSANGFFIVAGLTAKRCINNELNFCAFNKIDNIHALEDSLYSLYLGIAGTVDCIAEYEGELAVIDFKTAKKPKPKEWIENYFVQAAAYACMFYELTDILVKKFVILMSCENGEVVEYVIRGEEKVEYIKLLGRYVQNFVEHKLNEYGTRT